ncbi:MAG TPA: hypothetical protein VIY48_22075 [Candidatus Paceibacterota bacterium]
MAEQEHIVIVLTETGQTFKWKTNENPADVESQLLTREATFGLFIGLDDSGRPVRHQIWLENIVFVGIGEVGMIAGPQRGGLM